MNPGRCCGTTRTELVDFRNELIQTAAVAVAIIEDIDLGVAWAGHTEETIERIFGHIMDERHRQDEKWGPQHHSWSNWLSILGEEFGEACTAYNDNILGPTMDADKKLNLPKRVRWGKVDPADYGTPTTQRVTMQEALAHADQRIIEGYAPPLTFELDSAATIALDDDSDPNEGRYDRED